MNILNMNLISQVVGLIAFGVFILSMSCKKDERKKMLLIQTISFSIYSFQYFILSAFSGFVIYLLNAFKCFSFYKVCNKSKRVEMITLIIYLIAYILALQFCYPASAVSNVFKLVNVLPSIAAIIGVIGSWVPKVTLTKKLQVISCILWIIYNIYTTAYIGIVTELLIILVILREMYKEKKIVKVTS